MKVILSITLGLIFIAMSCNAQKNKKIETLLKSEDATDIILGNYLIGEAHDSSYVWRLLSNTDDSRISHDVRFKGMSVYQSKMVAIKKISNLSPPSPINYKPDSIIINFYNTWAVKNNLNNPR